MNDDVVLLLVDGSQEETAEFGRRVGRRSGLRVRGSMEPLTVEAEAARIETLGPAIEAAALLSGATIRLASLGAVIESRGLDAQPSRIWAAIGDAADRRAVDRQRGNPPSVDLLHFVGREDKGGRLVVVDSRPPLVDHPTSVPPDLLPTKFDDAGWHAEGAASAGQPPDHAWTHIALYLTWLIRHGLVDRQRLGRRAQRVRDGGIVDQGLINGIDGRLVSDLMTDTGVAFSEASYGIYTRAYERIFAGDPGHSVAPDAAAYARIEPELDAIWSAWNTRSLDHD